MQNQVAAEFARSAAALPPAAAARAAQSAGPLPAPLRDPFAEAMGSSILLPAVALLLGFVVVQFFVKPIHLRRS
jgi:hypothetical protein